MSPLWASSYIPFTQPIVPLLYHYDTVPSSSSSSSSSSSDDVNFLEAFVSFFKIRQKWKILILLGDRKFETHRFFWDWIYGFGLTVHHRVDRFLRCFYCFYVLPIRSLVQVKTCIKVFEMKIYYSSLLSCCWRCAESQRKRCHTYSPSNTLSLTNHLYYPMDELLSIKTTYISTIPQIAYMGHYDFDCD